MCGIAGIVSRGDHAPWLGKTRIARMLELLQHRGPDDQGFSLTQDNRCFLGNTRLAIVDTNSRFRLPFRSNNSASELIYNGEIFNHQSLRRTLQKNGCVFSTKSDTEVLYQLLDRYGISGLEALDGFWSFAFYDSKDHSLSLSRDLLGEKHLFYSVFEDEIIFASEPQAVIAASRKRLDLDPLGVASSWLYTSAAPGYTLIKGVKRLLPGTTLKIDAKGNISLSRTLSFHPEEMIEFFQSRPSLATVAERYQHALQNACAARVPTEVEFYATLSGGIDSNCVVGFSSKNRSSHLQTIHGLGSSDSPKRGTDLSEQDAARFASRVFSSKHLEFSFDSSNWEQDLGQIASDSFSGTTDPGSLAFQLVSKKVHEQGAKVVLFSDGPDELIGGYTPDRLQYRRAVNHRTINSAGSWLHNFSLSRKIMRRLGLPIIPHPFGYDGQIFRPIHQRSDLFWCSTLFGRDLANQVFGSYGRFPTEYSHLFDSLDFGQKMAFSYACQSLPDHFNVRSDLATMRYSVENRLPMQSPELVNLMLATPSTFRYGNHASTVGNFATTDTKKILRHVLRDLVGNEISSRGKYGFAENIMFDSSYNRETEFAEFLKSPFAPFRSLGDYEFTMPAIPGPDLIWFLYCMKMTQQQLGQLNSEFTKI